MLPPVVMESEGQTHALTVEIGYLGGRVKEDGIIIKQEINQRGRTAWACIRMSFEHQIAPLLWRLNIRWTEVTAYATMPPITPGSSWGDSQ